VLVIKVWLKISGDFDDLGELVNESNVVDRT